MNIIELKDICKKFQQGNEHRNILTNLDLRIDESEMVAIRGRSGSGKTTLLNIIGGIDYPDSGSYTFREKEIRLRNQNDAAAFRKKHIGVVVQHFALLDDLSVFENIAMPLWTDRLSGREKRERVEIMMEETGIASLRNAYPLTLSGGEKQRVAIARALIRKPDILLADEPTGALDEESGKQIVSLFKKLNREGNTILMVTHDEMVAASCSRILYLRDGQFAEL